MESSDMKRLYLEHREVEEARDLDAVVATFDDDCSLEMWLSAHEPRDEKRSGKRTKRSSRPSLTCRQRQSVKLMATTCSSRGARWVGRRMGLGSVLIRLTGVSPARSSTSFRSGTGRCRGSRSTSIFLQCAEGWASRSMRSYPEPRLCSKRSRRSERCPG